MDELGQNDGAALLAAAEAGNHEALRRLVDAGADIDHTNDVGVNPLGAALWNGHLDAAGLLVELGAAVGIDDAAALGDVDALRSHWPELPPADEHIGAYLMACRAGAAATVRWFLDNGAEVDLHPAGDEWGGIGCPGLHHAAVNGHTETVRVLLDAGADPALVDDVHGSQALAWAASAGRADVADILVGAGASTAHRNAHGLSAAELAADNGFEELAASLAAPGRDGR